ncbi:MAG: phenylacetate--CoA ligase family protein [Gemmatimonadales bacterium]
MPRRIIAAAGPVVAVRNLLQSSMRLEREQWLPPEVLTARRLRRLRRTLGRAAATKFYGAALRDAGLNDPGRMDLGDLERLPLLDRHLIARHGLDAFLSVRPDRLVSVTTSGSTGTPGRFFRSREEEADYSARWWRVYNAYGCSMWDTQVNVARVDKPDRAGPITMLRRIGVLPQVEKLASDAPPHELLERVRALHPPILTGYAGAIEALADHVLSTGVQIQPPRAVFCTAMEVTDRCLQLAEQAFRAPAVDVYVTNEFGVLAWSCPVRRDLLHVNDDSFVIEVVGPDGRTVPPGTLGELVVTSLGLTSMPLIRYRMGDMAAMVAGPCACGRGLGLLTRVHGRTAHAIRRTSGALITTPLVTSLFGRAHAHEWVRGFQVREEPGRRLRFLLSVRRPPSEDQRSALTLSVESAVGEEFEIAFEVVDRIPAAPSGKLQFLVPLAS